MKFIKKYLLGYSIQFIIVVILLVSNPFKISAQICTTRGQTPGSALPVCGTQPFEQKEVPICSTGGIGVPNCPNGGVGNVQYLDKNPFWYKFTCYESGTLGFLIKPNNSGDDYDWQLYDVTNRNVNDVLNNPSWVVTGNWAGTYGNTGASNSGVGFIQCASDPADNKNSFAKMPNLIVGHNYLLMISHYTETQSGYVLSFGGGTAVITDPKLPRLSSGEAACDGKSIIIKLNKDMKCSSLASNGSDFEINTTLTNIIGASSSTCNNGFDMETVILTLDNPIPPGDFIVSMKKGTDGTTLYDNCDREIPVGDNVSFKVYPLIPTPMDSVTALKCEPQTLELVFKKNMLCNSIAANGSDFEIIGGPVLITISSAEAVNCNNNLSRKIHIQLNAPIQKGGIYTIRLKNGSDGNPIIDECGQVTPVGSTVSFTVKDTVNADFTYNIIYGCAQNIVQYTHPGGNDVNKWSWKFDNSILNNTPNPIITYTNFQQKKTQLIVTNGVCSDTSNISIFFDNLLVADFDITENICPNETAKITNKSTGRILEWKWNFDNGVTSNLKNPPAQMYQAQLSADYFAKPSLIVKNDYGCYDTIIKPIKVIFSCFITVPKAFSPNGDGRNDFLYPLGAYKAKDLQFSVYNRFGQRLFYSSNWQDKWDGKFKGKGMDPGTYVWTLSYFDNAAGRRINRKGTTVLIR